MSYHATYYNNWNSSLTESRLNKPGNLCSLHISSSSSAIFMKQFATVSSVIMCLLILFCKVVLLCSFLWFHCLSVHGHVLHTFSFKVMLDLPSTCICPCIMLRLISFLILGPGRIVPTHTSTQFQLISFIGTMSRNHCTMKQNSAPWNFEEF